MFGELKHRNVTEFLKTSIESRAKVVDEIAKIKLRF